MNELIEISQFLVPLAAMKNLFPFERFHFKNQQLFDDLPADLISVLRKNETEIEFNKGETIFKEGTYPAGIYILQSGRVKKMATGYDQKEHIFYFAYQGEMLGYHSVLSEEPYCDSAIALEYCKAIFIPKNDFLEAVNQSHQLSMRLLANLSHEFGVFVHHGKILAQYTVRERTALSLLILKEKKSLISDRDSNIISLSRADLANYVGTVKETLVRVLHDFKEEKLIKSVGNSLEILDQNGLIEISNYK